jgi:hypothetical protein
MRRMQSRLQRLREPASSRLSRLSCAYSTWQGRGPSGQRHRPNASQHVVRPPSHDPIEPGIGEPRSTLHPSALCPNAPALCPGSDPGPGPPPAPAPLRGSGAPPRKRRWLRGARTGRGSEGTLRRGGAGGPRARGGGRLPRHAWQSRDPKPAAACAPAPLASPGGCSSISCSSLLSSACSFCSWAWGPKAGTGRPRGASQRRGGSLLTRGAAASRAARLPSGCQVNIPESKPPCTFRRWLALHPEQVNCKWLP